MSIVSSVMLGALGVLACAAALLDHLAPMLGRFTARDGRLLDREEDWL